MDRNELIREIQARYREACGAFNELERRHWAAREAIQLGRGGITLVSQALRMSPNTIKRGIQELSTGQVDSAAPSARIRKSGGGRKPARTLSVRSARTSSSEDSVDGALRDGANLSQESQNLTRADATDSASEKRRPRQSEVG